MGAVSQKVRSATTILVFDENSATRARLEVILREEGYNVVSAWDAYSAWKEFSRHAPALVFVSGDGDGPGLQFCRRVKGENEAQKTPVICVATSAENLVSSAEAGADDFLIQPFDRTHVVTRARGWLDSPRLPGPSA